MPGGTAAVPATAAASAISPATAAASAQQPAAAFGAAKAAMQPSVDDFAEGKTDCFTVLAAADAIAGQHKVRAADLRGWAKQQMDTMRADTASKPGLPELPCARDPEPSTSPAPLATLLQAIVVMVRRRVACSAEVADAVALWCAGTWGVFPPTDPGSGPDIYPRLHLHSPTKRCGKSTLLEIVQHVVRRPQAATDISEAAIYRTVEKHRPTFVIDEADRLLAKNGELVGLLNSGYVRTGYVLRTVEVQASGMRGFEPMPFPTFAPIALAGIGRIAPTVEDRSIRIELQRQELRRGAQRIGLRQLAKLQNNIAPHLMARADALGAAMATGIDDNLIPTSLNDRDADNWRPLLALAALADGGWLARARRAAEVLCASGSDSDRSNEWALRQVVEFVEEQRRAAIAEWRAWVAGGRKTIRPIAGGIPAQRPTPCRFVSSDALAGWLLAKDDSGFLDARDIGAVKLRVARVLRAFKVLPALRRANGKPARGYDVAAIRAVWRRYRP